MPPEASSRPEIGLKRIDTSTSEYGPKGATITLNACRVARWTSTRVPLGAPAMSSTAHCPSTVVQPSIPFVSKSTRSRSEEHTSELQSPYDLVCRLLLEKKNQRSHA